MQRWFSALYSSVCFDKFANTNVMVLIWIELASIASCLILLYSVARKSVNTLANTLNDSAADP